MPRTSRPMQVHPIVLRHVEVVRVTDVTPNLRRITLGGDELAAGTMGDGFERPPFRSDGFDDHVKIVLPAADGTVPHIGTQQEKRFAWNPEALARTRDYTVRAWNPEARTLDLDVVRHDHGLAAAWAFRARPGDQIHVAGPKSCALRNDEAEWHLLVGDETALPSIGRWLEEAPEATRGHAIVEIPTAADRQDIPTAADVEIEWLVRGDVPAGMSTQLFDAVQRVRMPDRRVYAWVGGEALTIAPIRRYLRSGLGLPKEDVEVTGYWRRPKAAVDDRGPRDDAERLAPASPGGDAETSMELLHEVHEMTELAPPIVTRAAVTLGIGPLIATGVSTPDELGRETGADPARLRLLLDAMTALGLAEREGDRYRNTARGGILMEESSLEALSLDNPANREALALVDLVDVLRSDDSSPCLGASPWRARRAADTALDDAHQDRSADLLQYVIDPLAKLAPVAEARTLAVVGDAAPYVASHIAGGRTVQLPGAGEAEWPAYDCAVLVGALEGRADDDALGLLRTAFAAGSALVLAEHTTDRAAADDHVAEHALTSLAVTGMVPRSSGRIGELLRAAGAAEVETTTLGWGFGAYGSVTVAHA
ncbi:NADPH-dependent ferric siderophore reductase [Lipingzhangella halophila]|uniref:NADPH-dependent ferric siderophore reductase n=1 Tax=Lipingzhangella halophila TaxID=1783352 RepID=A0A7W7RFS7_9ACTN|nr:siderophore-interacting protein [Lipingzhangella halophila]MBB4931191.1 NADPH-dependent ferric siderophore reductase [Lipingzhangella halophila]